MVRNCKINLLYSTVLTIVLLAALDLFRAYLNIAAIDMLFSLKELILIILLLNVSAKVRIKYSLLLIFIFLILYSIVNSRFSSINLITSFIFLKYIIVYFIVYLIFDNTPLPLLKKTINVLVVCFLIYSIISFFRFIVSPESLVHIGRISGDANPSYLSYIYLLCFIYLLLKKSFKMSLWFLIAGFSTLTKTFFVSLFCILCFMILFTKYRIKILISIIVLSPFIFYWMNYNEEILFSMDKAIGVLIRNDVNEYNSFDDRLSRISVFEQNNCGNFIFGYGTGKASPASVFIFDKFSLLNKNSTDFENQYLNIYYSLGIIGLFLLYFPILRKALKY